MADEYVVLGSDGVRSTTVVIRINVPSGDNAVGTAWATAAAEYYADRLRQDPEVGTRWPGRNDQVLKNGSVVEIVRSFAANVARPGIVAELETWVAAEATVEKARLGAQLKYWGKTGVV